MVDPHKILGVPKDASLDQIKAAYRQKLFKYHPDQGGDAWAFQQVETAYLQLTGTGKCLDDAEQEPAASQPPSGFTAAPQASTASPVDPRPISPTAMLVAGATIGAIIGAVVGAFLGISPAIAALIGVVPGIIAARFSNASTN